MDIDSPLNDKESDLNFEFDSLDGSLLTETINDESFILHNNHSNHSNQYLNDNNNHSNNQSNNYNNNDNNNNNDDMSVYTYHSTLNVKAIDYHEQQDKIIRTYDSYNNNNISSLKYNEQNDEIIDLKRRLLRRTLIINEIRTAYLKDVVILKNILTQLLTPQEHNIILTQYLKSIPSADLREVLTLHGPKEGEFRINPCDHCGGTIDIVIHDHKELIKLRELLINNNRKQSLLKLEIATNDTIIDRLNNEKKQLILQFEQQVRNYAPKLS